MAKKKDSPWKIVIAVTLVALAAGLAFWQNAELKSETGGRPAQLP